MELPGVKATVPIKRIDRLDERVQRQRRKPQQDHTKDSEQEARRGDSGHDIDEFA